MIVKRFENEGVKYIVKRCKSHGIVWQTTCGQWVKKVIAVRQGLILTGVSKEIETAPVHVTFVDNSVFVPNPFRS